MTNTKILLKLEHLARQLKRSARFCEETADEHVGHIGIRRMGMAYAFGEAAKDLINLIREIEEEQQ
jgi:hypothetical protein